MYARLPIEWPASRAILPNGPRLSPFGRAGEGDGLAYLLAWIDAVAVLPAASLATACKVCAPPVALRKFHLYLSVEPVEVATSLPSM